MFLLGCNSHPPDKAATLTTQPVNLAAALNDQGDQLLGAGNWPAAEDVLRRAVTVDPAYGPAHDNLGVALYRQAKYFRAYEEFERAAELMPAAADVRNKLGLVLESGDRLDDAVASFDRATALEPNNREYFANSARARVHRGDHDEATVDMVRKVAAEDDRVEWKQWAQETLERLRPTTRP